MPGTPSAPDRLFVGGSGRCGTHAIARLLAEDWRYHKIHTELRFHADPGGLPSLLAGEVELAGYMENLRGRWWRRRSSRGREVGFFRRLEREEFDPVVDEFEQAFPDDPWQASSRLVHGLLDRIALKAGKRSLVDMKAGKRGWVEQTNRNVWAAPTLIKLVPNSKVINAIRDGRDVASSVVTQPWGRDLPRALARWEKLVSDGESGASQIPADRLLVVNFQDFVADDRENAFEQLLDFIGVPRRLRRLRGRAMHRWFDRKIGGPKANVGRWREDLSEAQQDELNDLYGKALQRLIAMDGPARPLFERWLAALGSPMPAPVP